MIINRGDACMRTSCLGCREPPRPLWLQDVHAGYMQGGSKLKAPAGNRHTTFCITRSSQSHDLRTVLWADRSMSLRMALARERRLGREADVMAQLTTAAPY